MKRVEIDPDLLEQAIVSTGEGDTEEINKKVRYIGLVYRSMQRRRRIRNLTGLSAVLFVLVIAGGLFLHRQGAKPDYLALYRDYYKPAEFHTEYRGSTDADTLFAKSYKEFMAGDYPSATAGAENLITRYPAENDYWLLAGTIYQAANETLKAEQCYRHLLGEGGTFKKEAQWNLALLALKEGKPKDCRDLLNEYLKSADPTKKESARKLLKELR